MLTLPSLGFFRYVLSKEGVESVLLLSPLRHLDDTTLELEIHNIESILLWSHGNQLCSNK